jgi:hypothetical protein
LLTTASRSRHEHESRQTSHKWRSKKLVNYSEIKFEKSDLLINSYEEQKKIIFQIFEFCQKNKITFSIKLSRDVVQSSAYDKVVMVRMFDPVFDQKHWEEVNATCKQLGKTCYVLTESLVDFDNFEFVKIFSYPKLFGITALPDHLDFALPTPSRLYNCFISRVESVRQSWFYLLHTNNLIDQGYVSLLMQQLPSYSSLTGKDLFDHNHQTYQLNQLPDFEMAYRAWRDHVPFRNFEETGDLESLILGSKYSLVLESTATEDDLSVWYFTEKLSRSIQIPCVPLLFVQKHGIQKLKKLGFEIGNYMDHLDPLPWQERQRLLLDILIGDTVDFNPIELYNQSKHNRNLLQSWQREYQSPNFFEDFYNKVLES